MVTPVRPSAWSRTVPLNTTVPPQFGSTAHSYASATGRGSSVRAIQSSPVAGGRTSIIVRPDRSQAEHAGTLGADMDADDGLDDDGRDAGWVDPDDRLWRHPSELNETPWPQPVTAGLPGA